MPRVLSSRVFLAGACAGLVLTGSVLSLRSAVAAATRTFRQASAKDFEEGEAEGTAILPSGEVVPGLTIARTPLDAAFVWCAVASRDGATGYFGTGDEGRIYSYPLRAAPPGTRARKLAALDAAWVTALVTRADGTLVVGATPGGKIYAVDPRTGGTKLLGTVPAAHVWALVRDDKANLTYVGTGSPGKIFAIDDAGKARAIWDAHDKHVVSLAREADGTLLAGTSEAAILYRIKPDGQAMALQDFEAEEVRAIVRAPSGLYVAVNDFEKGFATASAAPGPVAAKGTKIVLSTGGPPSSAGTLPRASQRKAKAGVYRIEADGRLEQVFALGDGYLTSLAVTEDGAVLAAAGTQGHVYRLSPDRTASLVVDVPERQALALLRSGPDVWVGTGDVASLYRASPARGGQGRYVSKVLDAEFQSRWGALRWQGTGVAFEARSGNTAKPDSAWSPWKALEGKTVEAPTGARPSPGAAAPEVTGGSGTIASPAARYVQYRATIAGSKGRLRGVTVYYLPQNQRARITELTVGDATSAGSAAGLSLGSTSSVTGGSTPRPPRSTILKLRWKVENPDGDDLIYRLYFREQNEGVWRTLAGVAGDPLTKPEYDWNTEGIPDGLYIVHVVASDEREQPSDRALSATFDSLPLLVDNRKPVIRDLAGHYPTLQGRAQDDASTITQIEAAIDGGDWWPVAPADGIADELTEAFTVRLPKLSRGPHAVVVRATDSADNVGAADLVIEVP
jgi:outer membrane protein assembly factor BamB